MEHTPLLSTPMRGDIVLVVMGSGSVGSLFGGLMASEKFDVLLVGRKSHVDKINESGLRIKGLINKLVTVKAVDTIPQAKEFLAKSDQKIDYIFLLF